jgi:hypothetical protein
MNLWAQESEISSSLYASVSGIDGNDGGCRSLQCCDGYYGAHLIKLSKVEERQAAARARISHNDRLKAEFKKACWAIPAIKRTT